jgi:hypothetical protein
VNIETTGELHLMRECPHFLLSEAVTSTGAHLITFAAPIKMTVRGLILGINKGPYGPVS